ncbi:MAG: glycine--tRNA ligase subunit beta [Acidobacteria bacterium]|nr:glycine--tRNA ligase subunit beta [Acidobacteriota bacterium]
MDRELLLEIGCEELPASWLASLTEQIGEHIGERLKETRLAVASPIETFSTPRRLTVRIARVADRQSEFEETITGPPVSAAFRPDGDPTPAALGFARKYGVGVAGLARVLTPKGLYLAYQQRHRPKAAVDVLPDVLAALLRDVTFPRVMRWDALLDDGRGELPFGRPIRWLVFLYGGRVVPFGIKRSGVAQSGQVQEVRSGATTYGHRFLATSGRAGRTIKVRSFEDYRARLSEHFVVLDRHERSDRIARELDVHARRLGGRVSRSAPGMTGLIQEVPDLVEYPSVIGGAFPVDFLDLPAEVLTTTMIHHQHFFPIESESGRLLPAFLAVVNTQPDNARTIARNAERVLTARLRDARFFWESDRHVGLEGRLARLDTLLFHRYLGSYREKAERLARLAGWIAREVLNTPENAEAAEQAGRLAKVDLATDMVREFTELQGVMGGIYAREEGLPGPVWKAIYHHYLPAAVEPDAPPSSQDLGDAATSWAAVALADKLDTIVGLFGVGEEPTGSRDPFGLRRLTLGALRILIDLPILASNRAAPAIGALIDQAAALLQKPTPGWDRSALARLNDFILERLRYLFEQRHFRRGEVRAVTHERVPLIRPLEARWKLDALGALRGSTDLEALAVLFKRVKNIARELPPDQFASAEESDAPLEAILREPAELALERGVARVRSATERLVPDHHAYQRALTEIAALRPVVDRFFVEVLVMAEDERLRKGRLRLMNRLRNLILRMADISEVAPQAT